MSTQRLSPLQILTDVPLETAREAAWRALVGAGVLNVVIDTAQNLVVGATGANLTTYGQNITARFEPRADGTLISVRSEAQVQGTIDFGKSKRQSQQMADAIEFMLNRPISAPEPLSVEKRPDGRMLSPIAAPTGEIATPIYSGPVYGTALPPKRGTAVLIYGLLGISCCQIAAPFAWVYGSKALKEYGANDPGDKTMVRIGWVLGILGTAILVVRVGTLLFSLANN